MHNAVVLTAMSEAGAVVGDWLEASLLEALREPQTMDQLAARFPAMSWSQIFLSVDRLSRAGFVSIRRGRARDYTIALTRAA